jgi:hypothetical protein
VPISFLCSCGKQLRVPEDYAGRRVKCPGCGEPLTVPAGEAPARAAGTVRFACSCGKQMQARAEYAGQPAKCPGCGAVVIIPGAEEAAGSAGSRIRSDKPEPKRAGVAGRGRRDEEYEDEEPERRRRRRDEDEEDWDEPRGKRGRKSGKKKRALWPWLLAGSLALLLLVGGGLTAFLLLRGGSASDLAFIPPDAQGFVTIRVADVWKTDAAQKVVAQLKQLNPRMGDLPAEFEKEAGLTLTDVERLTTVFVDAQREVVWGIVLTSKPYDPKKIQGKLTNPQELKHEGKSYHTGTKDGQKVALYFASDRVLVVGPEEGVKRCLSFAAGKKAKGPLDDAIKLAAGTHHVVAAINPPPAQMQKLKAQMGGAGQAYQSLADVQVATVVLDVGAQLQLDATLRFPAEGKAKEAKTAIDGSVAMAKLFLPQLKQQFARGMPGGEGEKLFDQIKSALDAIAVEQKGTDVSVRAKTEAANVVIGMGLLLPAMQKVRGAATHVTHTNNLKQLALAMHMYADRHGGQFPPAVIHSKDGRPLYSWRVELLPYLEQQALYNEFHKDEPWNSPHNSQLLTRMPKVFALPGQDVPGQSRTPYQVFTGPSTPFVGRVGPRMPASFTDGTSNTILIAQANRMVPWTAPEDIAYQPTQPVKPLLGSNFGNYFVALADGSVRPLRLTIQDRTLHAAVTPAGGEILGPDW